ncbi:MAG TPA: hypothetical protein VN524_01165 [Hyphomicrobiaceae bacterium]|jgi:hypothetical protein|nr:hypothetical protein [Hyphomicrobiaceae bacterium]
MPAHVAIGGGEDQPPQAHYGALRGPVRRLGAPRIPVSYAPTLEDEVRVTADRIAATAREMIGAGSDPLVRSGSDPSRKA